MSYGLSITIDVDGVAGLGDGAAGFDHRLSARSERLYGIARGLPRILDVLGARDAGATFYVPGVTALAHRDEIAALVAGGHEVAHHGHTHRRPDLLSVQEQRAEIANGLDALVDVTGSTPAGYRAPHWELTQATLEAVAEHGLAYDSSLMADDGPYRIDVGGRALLEIPVHWTLDDAPYFAHTTDPAGLLAVWLAELDHARSENRHLTVTLHPDILGRPHRTQVLERLLDRHGGPTTPHSALP